MKRLLICAFALAALVACDKEPNGGEVNAGAGDVYMQFSIKMETTRTGTDGPNQGNTNSDATPDYEVGLDKENAITSVDIMLAREGQYYKAEKVEIKNVSTNTDINKTFIASFSSLNLVEGAEYKVYIYANCTAPAEFNENATSTADINAMTADNKFWMTNAYAANTIKIPTDLSAHNSPNSPFNMGEHYVERSMARFDYMPKGAYTITEDDAETTDVNEKVTVTLTEAAIINHSKEFYMLRRVSNDGTANGAVVGGVETPMNYVVDVDYAAKADGYTEAQVANFDAHLTNPADWKFVSLTNLTQKDNWEGTDDGTDDPMTGDPDADGDPTEEGTPEHALNEYYIWQYAKENTIPGTTTQENGISTGIVFKGKIEGAAVTAAAGEPIYVFENKLYGTWEKVVAAAEAENAPATLIAAVNAVGKTDPTVKALAAAGFTGYSADADDNYYAYYYYWNRHNDNGDNTTMGIMEFAVVRNNVYKLCVDKISKLGHPEPPTDPNDPKNPDPDPVDPTDPDEELNYYFNVTVKVLPWVVRVNHIEF